MYIVVLVTSDEEQVSPQPMSDFRDGRDLTSKDGIFPFDGLGHAVVGFSPG